jgi:hypothetical protein
VPITLWEPQYLPQPQDDVLNLIVAERLSDRAEGNSELPRTRHRRSSQNSLLGTLANNL